MEKSNRKPKSKKDNELAAFITTNLISKSNLTWEKRFTLLVNWLKENRGLKGLHLSVYGNNTPSSIYKAYVLSRLAEANGKYTDVTNEIL